MDEPIRKWGADGWRAGCEVDVEEVRTLVGIGSGGGVDMGHGGRCGELSGLSIWRWRIGLAVRLIGVVWLLGTVMKLG